MAKNNILQFNFTIDKNFKNFLRKPVNEGEIKRLAVDIDKVMFGKEGELAKMIENQAWKPLSAEWKKFKETHLGKTVPSNPPPNKCISTDIWIYTGKTKKVAETLGNKGYKKMTINPKNFLAKRGAFYTAEFPALKYVQYPNATRPLFVWTDSAKEKINQALQVFINRIATKFNNNGTFKGGVA